MKHLVLLAVMAAAATPALSQPTLSNYAQLGAFYGNTPRPQGAVRDDLVCLRRISDHARVCHSREGWRRVAASITGADQHR